MKLGFIGLGHMGHAMATRLLRGGHQLIVYNRSPAKARDLRGLGATVADTVAEACEVEAVITMVSDDEAIEAIVFGAGGIRVHLPDGAIHVSCSTISPRMADRLAKAHELEAQRFVAAPVLGRPEAAQAGELFVLAAGARATVEELAPVFEAFGQRTFVVSEQPDHALLVKLSCNFLITSMIESVGEAMALVGKAGIDPRHYLDILTSSLFGAPAYRTYGPLIAERRFEPAQFAATLGAKDIRLTLAAAEDLRVHHPRAVHARARTRRRACRLVGDRRARRTGCRPHGAVSVMAAAAGSR